MDLAPLAFGGSPFATLVIDPVGDRILAANDAARRLLGYGGDEPAGLSASGLYPGQRPALIVFSQAVLERGADWTPRLSPRHADGRSLELDTHGVRLALPEGDGLLVTLTDPVESRRRAIQREADHHMRDGLSEWQLSDRVFRNIERENQLILRAAGEGIYGVNAEGITTFVNPAAQRMLGWSAEDLVGRDMHSLVHHSHRDGSHYQHLACPIYAAFRDGVARHVEDEVFWRRDGSAFSVEYTSTPIRDRGHVVGAVIVFRDVSERREADERLRQALAEVDRLRARLELENAYLQEEIRLSHSHRGILGRSPAIRRVLEQIDLVAPTDAAVLVSGDSGTGKELIARAIHEASRRRDRPLIRVNCAAIPRDLFESEFFGHVRGAFTGAVRDRVGRFDLADGGTLFLDEVGEIPLELQSKLLRVLQEGQFERIGEARTRTVDVRVIAATNRDLRAEVAARRFREDLYYRLNVFPVEARPLRERSEDVPVIAAHLLEEARVKLAAPDLRLTEGDVRRLVAYDWPGNVRELENVIERAAILARNGRLILVLPDEDAGAPPTTGAGMAPPGGIIAEAERRQRERDSIEAALAASEGRIFGPGGAAERLGVKPTTLASRMKAAGIMRARFRTGN